MIVLVEGCDCSGKTTLLTDEFRDWQYVHHGAFASPADAFHHYEVLLTEVDENAHIVIDRMHISERIYGLFYWHKFMNETRYQIIESMCAKHNIQVIHCHPPLELVLKRWSERLNEEMIKDERIIKSIYNAYENIQQYTSLPVLRYDYTNKVYNHAFPIPSRLGI